MKKRSVMGSSLRNVTIANSLTNRILNVVSAERRRRYPVAGDVGRFLTYAQKLRGR